MRRQSRVQAERPFSEEIPVKTWRSRYLLLCGFQDSISLVPCGRMVRMKSRMFAKTRRILTTLRVSQKAKAGH